MNEKIEKCARLYKALCGTGTPYITFKRIMSVPDESGWDCSITHPNDYTAFSVIAETPEKGLTQLEAALVAEARKRIDSMQRDIL
jgi:hypothetical protein